MDNINKDGDDEVSVRGVILKLKSAIAYIKSKWIIILISGIIGGGLGLAYSIVKKPTFTAVSTFVLEDKNSSGGGMSQYAGLASLAGIDMGGGNGGLFQGDNIIELYKSRLMIEKALLSSVNLDGKNIKLIDLYVNFNNYRPAWASEGLGNLSFNGDPTNFNRKQDSLINFFTETINKTNLLVSKPDKKLSIIRVEVTSKNEAFSKLFSDKLVGVVNNFYIQTKTKKSAQNIAVMQRQADSVRRSLNSSISGVASSIDAAPNANPFLTSLRVPSQRKQVDVQASTAIYAEVIKNLEISKLSLRQETPLIQVIDAPVYPLKVTKTKKVTGIITGLFLTVTLSIIFLSIKRFFNSLMK
jgi:uncharacterized protein involved in exopolysaccharide biosynthesis